MKLSIPKQFAKDLEVAKHIRKIGFFESIIFYWFDRNTSSAVNMQSWIAKNLDNNGATEQFLNEYPGILDASESFKVKKALSFVNKYIVYTSDMDVWKVAEKWQTPAETWQLKTGDCEDGACLLYSILHNIGIEEERLRVVAGNVQGGGHCYVTWLSDEDALEYPLDWCYWFNKSVLLFTPYVQRVEYNCGTTEWWSFNSTSAYKNK